MVDRERSAAQLGKVRSAEGRPEASAPLRPDIGPQSRFRKKNSVVYRRASSLSPSWDGLNPAREPAEARIAALREDVARLAAIVDDGGVEGISDGDSAVARLVAGRCRCSEYALPALHELGRKTLSIPWKRTPIAARVPRRRRGSLIATDSASMSVRRSFPGLRHGRASSVRCSASSARACGLACRDGQRGRTWPDRGEGGG